MINDVTTSMRRLYWCTGAFGLLGAVWCLWHSGDRAAIGFFLGAAASLGNLWLWDWLAHMIEPGRAPKKSWQAGLFVGRYLILLGGGYGIVKVLGVTPVAVVLGLLTSTAAVLTILIIEIAHGKSPKVT
ncbi:MAG: ATP synthase subunit I [Bryobacteraceae bacterium]